MRKPTDVKRRKFGLCPVCYWDWMQTTEAGKIHYQKQFLPKAKRTTNRNAKIERKQKVESLKSISQLIQEARKPFQKWIRLRDANKSCISCGTVDSEIWDGGHYFKAEIYTGLIFDPNNVHKQCRKCNGYLGGNEIGFRKGLVDRYGESWVNDFESIADSLRNHKFEREQLISIKQYYQKEINERKKNGTT